MAQHRRVLAYDYERLRPVGLGRPGAEPELYVHPVERWKFSVPLQYPSLADDRHYHGRRRPDQYADADQYAGRPFADGHPHADADQYAGRPFADGHPHADADQYAGRSLADGHPHADA